MIESGRLGEAVDELGALGVAVERVGGPVSAWHRDRVAACLAQAQGRYGEAAEIGRRGFTRMRSIEPAPASGAYFALQCALAGHVGVSVEAEAFLRRLRVAAALPHDPAAEPGRAAARRGPPRRGRRVLPAGGPARHLVAAGVLRAARVRLRHARHRAARPGRRPGRGCSTGWRRSATSTRSAAAWPTWARSRSRSGRGAVALGRLDEAVDHLCHRRRARDGASARPATSPRPQLPPRRRAGGRGGPATGTAARVAATECAGLVAALGMTAYAERAAALTGASWPTTRCSARGRRRWPRWSRRASPTGRSPSGS